MQVMKALALQRAGQFSSDLNASQHRAIIPDRGRDLTCAADPVRTGSCPRGSADPADA